MEELDVKQVIISKQKKDSCNFRRFLKIVNEKNIKVDIVKRKDKLEIEKGLYIDILWPEEEQMSDNPLNNNSIVAKLCYGDFSMLFTGDIEQIAEEEIINSYKGSNKLKVDILKVAHHGSKTSSTQKFLEFVKPKIALIGVGEDNKFNHPSMEVLSRLQNLNCKIYRTDKLGEIVINVNSNGGHKIQSYVSPK